MKNKIRQLIREVVNFVVEGADNATVDGVIYYFENKDAIPFFYYNDVLYLGDFMGSHWEIVFNKMKKEVEALKNIYLMNDFDKDEDDALDKAENLIKKRTEYNGRLWTERKVIAFWQYPTKEKLNSIISDLNQKFHGIEIDNSWKIIVTVNGVEKFVSVADYTGGKLSAEDYEKYKQHMMSPLIKHQQGLVVTPKGWGSTHKDYAGHRAIDRALGRAESYEAGLQKTTKPKITPNTKDLEGNKLIGMKMLADEAHKFKSSEELLRGGGFSTDALDLAAFGFTDSSIKQLMPQQLKIKWKQDLAQAKFEQDEYHRRGMPRIDWARKINLSEPIDVSFDGNNFFLEDGHHRYVAAKTLNLPLNVTLEIKANPLVKLSDKDYDEFHREFYDRFMKSI